MQWITNANKEPTICNVAVKYDETVFEAVERYKQMMKQFVIGPPKATDTFTVEQLQSMNIVGLYEPD